MTGLDIFALIVIIVLVAACLGIWAMLGAYPGKIARQRNHPQADAIAMCGWWGVITMGILCPLAFVWAYTNPPGGQAVGMPQVEKPDSAEREEGTT